MAVFSEWSVICLRMVIDRAAESIQPPVDGLAGSCPGNVPPMAKLLYKPFGILLAIVTGKLASAVFDKLWNKLDRKGDGTVPAPTEKGSTTGRAVAATAVQAATYAGTKTAVDRFGVRAFYHLTGLWAGDPSQEELAEKAAKKARKQAKKDAKKQPAAA